MLAPKGVPCASHAGSSQGLESWVVESRLLGALPGASLSKPREAGDMNPVVPLQTKPIECKCESDMRSQTQVYACNAFQNEGRELTMTRVYTTEYKAEIRCEETNLRWVVK